MRILHNMSIQRKQRWIIMLTSNLALLLACVSFMAYDVFSFRREIVERVSSLAEVVGKNTTAAIDFNDAAAAEQTLAALHGEPNIVLAHVHLPGGDEFASYARSGSVTPPEIPATFDAHHEFSGGYLHLFRPITRNDEEIGMIELVASLDQLQGRMWRYLGIVAFVFLVSSSAAFWLSTVMGRVVSRPILDLARVARAVAQEKNYSVRATKGSDDELGQLVDGFNEMLAEIQERDFALQAARDTLEHSVRERTAELAGTNQALQNEVGERERAQSFLNSVVEHLPIPVFIKEAKELRFVLWNKAGEKLTGISNAEMIGKNDFDFFPQADAEHYVAKDRAAIASKVVLEIPEEKLQTRAHGVRLLQVWKVPIFDATGQPAFLLGIAEDITERKQAEAALAEASNLMDTLLENSPDLIYFKDRESRFLRYSKRFLHRLGLADFKSLHHKTDFDIFDEAHARPAYEDEQEIIRTGQPIIGKAEKEVWLDGRVTWALTSKLPLRDAQGRIIGTFGISKDITALKEAEAKLEQTHKQLLETSRQAGMAEVATSVLHNVGNVLNSVNTSASVLADRLRNSQMAGISRVSELLETNRHDLAGFLTANGRADQVINFLKSLAQHLTAENASALDELQGLTGNIEHIKEIVAMQQSYARISGVTEKVKPTDLVEDALRMNAGALLRHQVQLVRDYAPDVPEIMVEKHKVLQILINLIRNAKYACDDSNLPDKTLTLRVTHDPTHVGIVVADNGVGIAPENLTRIFSHGFTTRKEGHGFGLHSGALAAKEMGGSLTAHSDGPGQGATFTLELPCHPPELVECSGSKVPLKTEDNYATV